MPTSKSSKLTPEQQALAAKWYYLARWVVEKLWGKATVRNLGREEAEAAALFGIARAALCFDPTREVEFQTYAVAAARAHILRAARQQLSIVRIPDHAVAA